MQILTVIRLRLKRFIVDPHCEILLVSKLNSSAKPPLLIESDNNIDVSEGSCTAWSRPLFSLTAVSRYMDDIDPMSFSFIVLKYGPRVLSDGKYQTQLRILNKSDTSIPMSRKIISFVFPVLSDTMSRENQQ